MKCEALTDVHASVDLDMRSVYEEREADLRF